MPIVCLLPLATVINSSSPTVSDYHASIWVYMEPPLGTISCCLPFLSRLFGAKVMRGLRHLTNRMTKGTSKGSARVPSDNSSTQPNKYGTHPARGDTSMEARQDLLPDSRDIHLTTTTTVMRSAPVEEGHEMSSYRLSVTSPAKAMSKSKSESTSSLV